MVVESRRLIRLPSLLAEILTQAHLIKRTLVRKGKAKSHQVAVLTLGASIKKIKLE
jgi:hypothetical protein